MLDAAKNKTPLVFPSVDVEIASLNGTFTYFMTDDINAVNEKLETLGYRAPQESDWRLNPALAQSVRDKMAELGTPYSMTFSHESSVLNYYVKGTNMAAIVMLDELKIGADKIGVDKDAAASEDAAEKKEPLVFQSVKVKIDFLDKTYDFFMTDSLNVVNEKLAALGYRAVRSQDWRWNPGLARSVKSKMLELKTPYSMTFSHGSALLNACNFKTKFTHVIYLRELKKGPNINPTATDEVAKRVIYQLKFTRKLSEQKNWPPLMFMATYGPENLVEYYIAKKVDLNYQDDDGISPLLLAVMRKRTKIVQMLVDAGADVNLKTNNGISPLAFAVTSNWNGSFSDIIKILTDAGAALDAPRSFGEKPAARLSFHETLAFFISQFTTRGLSKASAIYKNTGIGGEGGISKQLFSKIRSNTNPNFRPSKNNVLLLAIGMRLDVPQTETLLMSAGYVFENNKFDGTIKEFIKNRNYNIVEIEATLEKRTGKYLGKYYEDDDATETRGKAKGAKGGEESGAIRAPKSEDARDAR